MTVDDDWMRDERKHEFAMADIASRERERTRQARTERIGYIVTGLTISIVVGRLCFVVWRIVATVAHNNTERDTACYASGGTRATLNNYTECIHIQVKQPTD